MATQKTNGKQRFLDALETAAKMDTDLRALLEQYRTGYLLTQDGTIHTVQQANSVSEIAMFDPINEKRDGIYSLSKAQLDKSTAFLVTGMQMLAYAATTKDQTSGQDVPATLNPKSPEEIAAMLATDKFSLIGNFPALANGEFNIRINRKAVLDKLSNRNFDNTVGFDGKHTLGLPGFFRLENPILIKPEVPIEMNLRLAVPTPPSLLIEVVFYGTSTITA